ncbi:hypothetical protein RFI_18541 [Reticulomyxa filosa]|uniref:Uncharacterized protein n=1 Tax=Reticulomyxa filosa TaxID=46433 RepID=X6N063_RETFI|nr:hypothetical protein RFI_18541 [Reticulomyxa filosa]|eukprot:ETO18712.1 hypothetical protein RFI_18541 [Reticulomyxa filosa]
MGSNVTYPNIVWENYNVTILYVQVSWIAMLLISGILTVHWNENRMNLVQRLSISPPTSTSALEMLQNALAKSLPFKIKRSAPEEDRQQYKQRKVTLGNLLEYGKGYESFMLHLTRELSVENLLVITELVQMQRILLEFGYLNKDKPETHITDLNIPTDIEIPLALELGMLRTKLSSAPTSGSRKYGPILEAWVYIYKKYINAKGAPYMVNISWRIRASLSIHFNRAQPWLLNSGSSKQKVGEILSNVISVSIEAEVSSTPSENKVQSQMEEEFFELVRDLRFLVSEIFGNMNDSFARFQIYEIVSARSR